MSEMSVFETLSAINVNDHVDKKGKFTYLSWPWAWAEVKKRYPTAHYKVWRDEFERPYICCPDVGYMVFTTVEIDGVSHEMWLPVMDGRNMAIQKPTMMDINKTIMRCLVKNLAMFGLGLYIYAGEDLPGGEEPPAPLTCTGCGKPIAAIRRKDGKIWDPVDVAEYSVRRYGVTLCEGCMKAAEAARSEK